ncbi:hypothetical protein BpHYR1_022890 [Brachionus plicatilis]|uniref:Uncharacterized protein n=1 Tax=Brachionus plicatilis TaxID=10195 RepID=A0A3M7SG62_BRAPC|nr:hypothetical protein BpHYR1_022890 [Brachionus plicatilis]
MSFFWGCEVGFNLIISIQKNLNNFFTKRDNLVLKKVPLYKFVYLVKKISSVCWKILKLIEILPFESDA